MCAAVRRICESVLWAGEKSRERESFVHRTDVAVSLLGPVCLKQKCVVPGGTCGVCSTHEP